MHTLTIVYGQTLPTAYNHTLPKVSNHNTWEPPVSLKTSRLKPPCSDTQKGKTPLFTSFNQLNNVLIILFLSPEFQPGTLITHHLRENWYGQPGSLYYGQLFSSKSKL